MAVEPPELVQGVLAALLLALVELEPEVEHQAVEANENFFPAPRGAPRKRAQDV